MFVINIKYFISSLPFQTFKNCPSINCNQPDSDASSIEQLGENHSSSSSTANQSYKNYLRLLNFKALCTPTDDGDDDDDDYNHHHSLDERETGNYTNNVLDNISNPTSYEHKSTPLHKFYRKQQKSKMPAFRGRRGWCGCFQVIFNFIY